MKTLAIRLHSTNVKAVKRLYDYFSERYDKGVSYYTTDEYDDPNTGAHVIGIQLATFEIRVGYHMKIERRIGFWLMKKVLTVLFKSIVDDLNKGL